jgi:hypothetical protein
VDDFLAGPEGLQPLISEVLILRKHCRSSIESIRIKSISRFAS